MTSVTPFLWFKVDVERALAKYRALFDAKDVDIEHAPDGSLEQFASATLKIGESEIIIFNGGPQDDFAFNPAHSLFVVCGGQDEVDRYWDGLAENGVPGQCGWVTDEFGVTWQIVPQLFFDLAGDPDLAKASRVFNAMRSMNKFDCARLQRAYDGEDEESP